MCCSKGSEEGEALEFSIKREQLLKVVEESEWVYFAQVSLIPYFANFYSKILKYRHIHEKCNCWVRFTSSIISPRGGMERALNHIIHKVAYVIHVTDEVFKN